MIEEGHMVAQIANGLHRGFSMYMRCLHQVA